MASTVPEPGRRISLRCVRDDETAELVGFVRSIDPEGLWLQDRRGMAHRLAWDQLVVWLSLIHIFGDGALGFWAAVREVFPGTREQRCWFHKIANVLNCLPKSAQPGAKAALAEIWNCLLYTSRCV